MKKYFLTSVLALVMTGVMAQLPIQNFHGKRGMWASIAVDPESGALSTGEYKNHLNKLLLSWRMLPTDAWDTGFVIYSRSAYNINTLYYSRLTSKPVVNATCYQTTCPTTSLTYYLIPASYFEGSLPVLVGGDDRDSLRAAAVDSVTIGENIYKDKLPYVQIDLAAADDCSDYPAEFKYQANDCSVGDLDGDGDMEIVVKRLLTYYNTEGAVVGTSEGAGDSDPRARHIVLFEAYKLDGTLLWRVKSGPNIIAGNSSNFAVADLDGDGCAEVVTKTGEGTVFGDGYEIPDTDGDGIVDYRSIWPAGHYIGDGPKGYGGPEFFSVIDGKTGKELARANFICRGKEGETPAQLAANWEANDWKWDPRTKKYQWKLANSFRLGVAKFQEGNGMQIFLGRGIYGRTIVEGWHYSPTPSGNFDATLTRLWKLDTDVAGGADKNKDGKPNSAYAGQGNHAFNVADLDGDGLDEVMYGSCAWDNDGTGLWTSGLGHGDANHVGRFLPDREGLQVFHCLETGTCEVALHDAKDGAIIWAKYSAAENDQGRCMTADVTSSSKGYEFWMYGGELFDQAGNALYSSGSTRAKESSVNAGIWFDGYLNRQMINENIINSYSHGRTFTMYRFDESFNNSTKSNPGWYGDMVGDWREEVIVPDQTKLKNLKVFSTWYPTEYKLPYLMSDHTYYMQCIHQQVGYNQPTNIGGYYLGSDMDFAKVPLETSGIENINAVQPYVGNGDGHYYDLSGRKVTTPSKGIYVRNGKKYFFR